VSLQDAVYEPNPDPEKLPDFWTLAHHRNRLDTLVFRYSPAALMALRKAFKEGGMRTQERQLTYAIERTKRQQDWDPSWHAHGRKDERQWRGKAWGKLESLFKLVAFELTSNYGMSHGRPLKILLVSILAFSWVYMAAFWGLFTTRGRAGIWATWPPDRVYQQEGLEEEGEAPPTRVTRTFILPRGRAWVARQQRPCWGALLRGFSILSLGLYFSLLSASSLGWRDITVGTWISRLQPREYILRATGWVRVVAGLQSLLSIYLLALWLLTYFGRPFE
jgi:hypothetical protein